jgi:hypothetical protein
MAFLASRRTAAVPVPSLSREEGVRAAYAAHGGTDGKRYPAGAFVGVGAKEMHCNLSSAVLRPDATGFEIRDRRGDVVVSSTFA